MVPIETHFLSGSYRDTFFQWFLSRHIAFLFPIETRVYIDSFRDTLFSGSHQDTFLSMVRMKFGVPPAPVYPVRVSQRLVRNAPEASPDLPFHAMPCHAEERLRNLGVSVTSGGRPAPVYPEEASQWLVSNAP